VEDSNAPEWGIVVDSQYFRARLNFFTDQTGVIRTNSLADLLEQRPLAFNGGMTE